MKYKQLKSNAYHPESQGALERFHQTLKNMMKTFCLDSHKDWDNGVRMLQLVFIYRYLVKRKEALSYNFTFRYEDDVLSLNNLLIAYIPLRMK